MYSVYGPKSLDAELIMLQENAANNQYLGSGELEAGWPLKTWYRDFEAVCHIRISLTNFVLMNKRTSILRNRSNNTNGVWNPILRSLRQYQLKSGWTTDFLARTVISEWKTCKQKKFVKSTHKNSVFAWMFAKTKNATKWVVVDENSS